MIVPFDSSPRLLVFVGFTCYSLNYMRLVGGCLYWFCLFT